MFLLVRRLSLVLVAVVCTVSVYAEQLTTVAVVDTAKVYSAFFRDSAPVREYEKAKQSIQDDITKYQNEIKKLQNDRLNAVSANNSAEALRLEQEINTKQQFLNDFRKVKLQQLNDQQKTLMQSDVFLSQLAAAIKYTAESEGYTLVMDSSSPGLRFWSTEIDITNKVLEYLRRNTSR